MTNLLRIIVLIMLVAAQDDPAHGLDERGTWRGASGELEAMLIVTDKPHAFIEEWSRPPGPLPKISSIEHAYRGDTVVGFVFFGGCKAKKGNCDAEVDLKLLRPDGSVYADFVGLELWKGKPAMRGLVSLSVANLSFRVEPEDPLGVYKLLAVVHDRNAKRRLSLERLVEVRAE